MFTDYNRVVSAPCTRDIEAEVKRLKSRLDISKELLVSLTKLMQSDLRYEVFDGPQEHISFFAVIGGLSIRVPLIEKEYENLLKEME